MAGFLSSFGKAPLAIAATAVIAGVLGLATGPQRGDQAKPDLTMAVFSKEHRAAYEPLIAEFERERGVHVQLQLVESRALQSRLQSAMQAGAAVPDLVELVEPSIGYFTRGPLGDVGLADLTERIAADHLDERLLASRFGLWSSRGRIFAIPHDVHPVALAYRADLCEQLGIDVSQLTTWNAFLEAGKRISVDRDGDGAVDTYMIDLPHDGGFGIQVLLHQRGGALWNEQGQPAFDSPLAIDTVCWYVRATRGAKRIAFSAGFGQTLAKAMLDGVALFYLAPDWRTKAFANDVPQLAGKMRLMPLPAWIPGGRRTSTWGGTGLAMTRACTKQDLAWELAKRLYLNPEKAAQNFRASNILPPDREAWKHSSLDESDAFYGGLALGRFFADLAPLVPPITVTAWEEMARSKLNEAVLAAGEAYERDPALLESVARSELTRCADYVRRKVGRSQALLTETSP